MLTIVKVNLSILSDQVVQCLNSNVEALRSLPGGEGLELEETDLADLAEKELLAAAAAIEASAAKLLSRAKREEFGIDLEEGGISDAIIDSARSIAFATKTLVQASTVVQRDIVKRYYTFFFFVVHFEHTLTSSILRGKAVKAANPYKKDPAWAEGLISAAREVATSTEDMVEVANDASMKKVRKTNMHI